MGYRSDVYLRVSNSSVPVLNIARKMDKNLDEMISRGTTGLCRTDMYWECTKWYESYPEVAAVINILSQLPAEDFGFIRVGESADDVEEDGDPAGHEMYVCRRVEW